MEYRTKQCSSRHLAVQILDRIFQTGGYSDVLLNHGLNRSGFHDSDRSLTCELVYGTLRWIYWLDWILKRVYHGKWSQMPRLVQSNLEVALYQILYLDRIPNYAAVNEAVKIAKMDIGEKWGAVVNGILRSIINNFSEFYSLDFQTNDAKSLSVRWSHPIWLVKKLIQDIGFNRTENICRFNNQRPSLKIRVNPLRTDRRTVQENLLKNGIKSEVYEYLDEFLIVDQAGPVLDSQMFRDGFYSIQDISAGLVAHLIDPKPGEKILDLAAAPGGKTTHLCELAKDQALIIAADIHFHRLIKLIRNRERLGIRFQFSVVSDGKIFAAKPFDKVLIDAPCSATGILQRRAEIRYRRKLKDLFALNDLQAKLLENGANLVRPGGNLIYSTCSILKEENETMIDKFLNRHPEYTVENANNFIDSRFVTDSKAIRTWPDLHGIDGSFAVRLKKKESTIYGNVPYTS